MKIGCTDGDASVPKPLLNSCVPPEILFWLQRLERSRSRVKAKNLVLTARRTESGRDARVQRCVRLIDLVTARDPIRPNIPELIEVIDSSTRDKNEIVDIDGRLQISGDLFRFVANERWAKQHEWPFLP